MTQGSRQDMKNIGQLVQYIAEVFKTPRDLEVSKVPRQEFVDKAPDYPL